MPLPRQAPVLDCRVGSHAHDPLRLPLVYPPFFAQCPPAPRPQALLISPLAFLRSARAEAGTSRLLQRDLLLFDPSPRQSDVRWG